ncbi:MAG: cytochrome c [Ignavibacteria bacterium]|jgi:cytochrome c2
MTNAQKWVAAFLIVFIALFLLSKVTEKEEDFSDELDFYSEQQNDNNINASSTDGLSLLNKIGCTNCHGVDLKGTKLAPTLYSGKEYWSRDNLINYLRNPSSYSGDERFEAYKEKYKTVMPAYGNIDVKDLGKIVDYLLNLEGE